MTKDGLSVVITRLIDPKKVYIVCTNTCVIREALKKLVFSGIFPKPVDATHLVHLGMKMSKMAKKIGFSRPPKFHIKFRKTLFCT